MFRDKVIAPSIMIAAILLFIACIATSVFWRVTNGCYNDRPPLRNFYVTLDLSQQKRLIQQFQDFANKNGFKFAMTYYTPNDDQVGIDLTRKDTEITVDNVPFGLEKYNVGFYNNDCIHPTVASEIDGLVTILKTSISEIPGATITEGK